MIKAGTKLGKWTVSDSEKWNAFLQKDRIFKEEKEIKNYIRHNLAENDEWPKDIPRVSRNDKFGQFFGHSCDSNLSKYVALALNYRRHL